ncbi:MAG: fibronectin type III domain-containing protein [Actinobacteria bacterium]|nr:fibronectin type III domain-containing protein [Actinomycetota bacterium]MCB8996711.1 fibronectin type III domain-containing protein [Actinomycetota bacterium]MCB9415100.1 fibronectin type III domain-containing protein [Actinomycetota bacterium]
MAHLKTAALSAIAGSAVIAAALFTVPAQAAVAAPPAPKGLTVTRDGANPHDLNIAWKPVPGVANYMVRVNDGAKDTNLIVPADATSAVFHGEGNCTTYRVSVSAVADKDLMGTTGKTFVPSLAPGSVVDAKASRSGNGTSASVTWEAPRRPGTGPITGYDLRVRQVSNGKVVHESTQKGTTLGVDGLDPDRMYAASITATNEFGGCVTSKVVLGNEKAAAPDFTVVRPPAQPASATITWKPTKWSGYGATTGYRIGYKRLTDKGYTWREFDPDRRSATIDQLDPTVNWDFVMRTVNGKSSGLISKPYRLYRSGYDPVNANVTITGKDQTITVDFSEAVGSSLNYPIARIDIAKANGTKGFTDRHSVTNKAGRVTFDPVPCGTYEVVVTGIGENSSKQLVRTSTPVCEQPAICFTSTLQNGSFESPAIPNSTYKILPSSTTGLAWQNTAENFVELWSNGFSSSSNGKVTAPDGRQLAELNANKAGTLYQDLPTTPGTTMRWHLKHRGRAGTDTMRVLVGAPGAKLTQSGADLTTGNTAWVQYTDSYKIPAGQTTTRFAFQAVKTASSISVGNFLDDIVFTPEQCQ